MCVLAEKGKYRIIDSKGRVLQKNSTFTNENNHRIYKLLICAIRRAELLHKVSASGLAYRVVDAEGKDLYVAV